MRRDIDELIQVPDIFAKDIAFMLADLQTPITEEERTILLRLMANQKLDLTITARFNVVSGPAI